MPDIDPVVPHPGPAPKPFEFPFAEARNLMRVLDETVARFDPAYQVHKDAMAAAVVDFAGPARDRFDQRFGDRMRGLVEARIVLEQQLDRLRRRIWKAETQLADRDQQMIAWRARRDRWEADQATPRVG